MNLSRRKFLQSAAVSATVAPSALRTFVFDAAAQEPKSIVIDCHVHFLRRAGKSLVGHNSFHEYNGDLWVAEADRAGVDKGLLKTYSTQDLSYVTKADLDTTEEYMVQWAKKYPNRLLWMDVFNPKDDDMNQWKEKIKDPLLKGLSFYPTNFYPSGYGLDHRYYTDLLDLAVQQKKKPVLITFEQTPSAEKASRLKSWVQLVSKYGANLHWMINHGGYWWRGNPSMGMLDRRPLVAAVQELNDQYDNIWFETAAQREEYPYVAWQEKVHALMEEVGYDKVGFGTDWPGADTTNKYFQLVDAVRLHADWLSSREKRWFLGENAARFMVLPEAKPLG